MKKTLLLAVLASLTASHVYADSSLYAVGSVGWSHESINKNGMDTALRSQ
jgi:hypothetical protein